MTTETPGCGRRRSEQRRRRLCACPVETTSGLRSLSPTPAHRQTSDGNSTAVIQQQLTAVYILREISSETVDLDGVMTASTIKHGEQNIASCLSNFISYIIIIIMMMIR